MNGFSRLAFVETKLFLREKAATLAVFGLPVALVIGFGLIPGFGQPQKSLSDQIGTEYIASLGVAIVLATLGLNGVPMVIGQYRERGILRRLGITVGVTVAAGAWIGWMIILHPGWTQRPWLMRVYFIGLVAFTAVLTVRSPWFAFFTWLGFMHAFRFLGGAWRWVGCAAVAIFFAMAQSGGFHRPTVAVVAIWVLLGCVGLVLVGVFVFLGEKTGEQNRVLVLTTFDTDTDVVPAIEAGGTGYLLKDSPPDELLRGVRAAARGEAVLSPSVATRLLGQVRQPAREPLSQRELDILGLIACGCSNREAAGRLFISEATVKTHLLHIYAKLGVNDRAAAVATGFERGLLPRP